MAGSGPGRESLLDQLAADPNAPIALRFRMFVEHVRFMPALAEIAEQLYENGSLLDWPSAEEMAKVFPHIAAKTSRDMLMFHLRSYWQAW
jgi:hypothetical protein